MLPPPRPVASEVIREINTSEIRPSKIDAVDPDPEPIFGARFVGFGRPGSGKLGSGKLGVGRSDGSALPPADTRELKAEDAAGTIPSGSRGLTCLS